MTLGEPANSVLDNYFINWMAPRGLSQYGPWPIRFSPLLTPHNFVSHNLGHQLHFTARSSTELAGAIGSSLKQGFLVRLIVDEYHIPDRRAYHNQHKLHDVLVTGASSDLQSFELAGYCADRRYRKSLSSIIDLSNAYFGGSKQTGAAGFVAFKAAISNPISTDLQEIKRQLTCFLECRKSADSREGPLPWRDISYGLAVFDACEEYVRNVTPSTWLDQRIFSIMAEHSQMMHRRGVRLEPLLKAKFDPTASDQAKSLSARLKLLSLIPKNRRSEAQFVEMGKIIRQLKEKSEINIVNMLRMLGN